MVVVVVGPSLIFGCFQGPAFGASAAGRAIAILVRYHMIVRNNGYSKHPSQPSAILSRESIMRIFCVGGGGGCLRDGETTIKIKFAFWRGTWDWREAGKIVLKCCFVFSLVETHDNNILEISPISEKRQLRTSTRSP